ncbi:hypothetical protein ACP70R_015339 [Stipagrostis hirtigluma subsp. patula]
MFPGILNSCNAAATSAAGGDEASDYYLLFALLEEGRRAPPPSAPPAVDDATAGRRDAGRRAGHLLSRAWKIAIRAFVVVATLVAVGFVVSGMTSCESWSEAEPSVASLLMIPGIGAFVWAITLDV